jgi:HAD superfamily hydrolase (TIGR01509 family)
MRHDVKVILFDVNGVLIRFGGGPKSILAGDAWERWMSLDCVRKFETGRIDSRDFFFCLVSETQFSLSEEDIRADFESWPDGLYEGVPEMLSLLQRKGYLLATLSNTNYIHWNHIGRKTCVPSLIQSHFPSHKTGYSKPAMESFMNVSNCLEVSPSKIFFVDDNKKNVEAASSLGFAACQASGENIRSVLVANGIVEESELYSHAPAR